MCGCTYSSPTKTKTPFSTITSKLLPAPHESTKATKDANTSARQDARRAELHAITSLFLLPGSPKELNIPAPMRAKALSALENSTEPEHLASIADHCYILLKSCSHRNFIRLGVSNGTFETVCMATSVGIVMTLAGFLCIFILAFASPALRRGNRWRGLAAWPLWCVGMGLVLSGLRGSCFFLLLFSRRQPLPWEKYEDSVEGEAVARESKGVLGTVKKLMIFDRKLKVGDGGLRRLQRLIVMQSVLGGMIFATVMELFFLSVPIWK